MAPKTQIILRSVKQLHIQIFGKETFQLLTNVCVCNKYEYSEQDTAIILNYGSGYLLYGNAWSEIFQYLFVTVIEKNSAGSFWSQEDSPIYLFYSILPVYLLLQKQKVPTELQFIFFSKNAFHW